MIGNPNETVEIDDSKFGRGKYVRGHTVKSKWAFGGVERGSGRTFLVPVPDRTADTLTTIIYVWIEFGTAVISDCWGAYSDFYSQGSTHRAVNHSIQFGNPDTGDHTNKTEITWRSVKVFLGEYNSG